MRWLSLALVSSMLLAASLASFILGVSNQQSSSSNIAPIVFNVVYQLVFYKVSRINDDPKVIARNMVWS